MRLKIFLSSLFFTIPIAFLNGSFESAEALCQKQVVGLYFPETSGYKSIIRTKRCNSKKAEFVQVENCWEEGDLLSQRRYCLGESLTELEKALVD